MLSFTFVKRLYWNTEDFNIISEYDIMNRFFNIHQVKFDIFFYRLNPSEFAFPLSTMDSFGANKFRLPMATNFVCMQMDVLLHS